MLKMLVAIASFVSCTFAALNPYFDPNAQFPTSRLIPHNVPNPPFPNPALMAQVYGEGAFPMSHPPILTPFTSPAYPIMYAIALPHHADQRWMAAGTYGAVESAMGRVGPYNPATDQMMHSGFMSAMPPYVPYSAASAAVRPHVAGRAFDEYAPVEMSTYPALSHENDDEESDDDSSVPQSPSPSSSKRRSVAPTLEDEVAVEEEFGPPAKKRKEKKPDDACCRSTLKKRYNAMLADYLDREMAEKPEIKKLYDEFIGDPVRHAKLETIKQKLALAESGTKTRNTLVSSKIYTLTKWKAELCTTLIVDEKLDAPEGYDPGRIKKPTYGALTPRQEASPKRKARTATMNHKYLGDYLDIKLAKDPDLKAQYDAYIGEDVRQEKLKEFQIEIEKFDRTAEVQLTKDEVQQLERLKARKMRLERKWKREMLKILINENKIAPPPGYVVKKKRALTTDQRRVRDKKALAAHLDKMISEDPEVKAAYEAYMQQWGYQKEIDDFEAQIESEKEAKAKCSLGKKKSYRLVQSKAEICVALIEDSKINEKPEGYDEMLRPTRLHKDKKAFSALSDQGKIKRNNTQIIEYLDKALTENGALKTRYDILMKATDDVEALEALERQKEEVYKDETMDDAVHEREKRRLTKVIGDFKRRCKLKAYEQLVTENRLTRLHNTGR